MGVDIYHDPYQNLLHLKKKIAVCFIENHRLMSNYKVAFSVFGSYLLVSNDWVLISNVDVNFSGVPHIWDEREKKENED